MLVITTLCYLKKERELFRHGGWPEEQSAAALSKTQRAQRGERANAYFWSLAGTPNYLGHLVSKVKPRSPNLCIDLHVSCLLVQNSHLGSDTPEPR